MTPAQLCRQLEEADPGERRRRRRDLRAEVRDAEIELCHAVRRLQPGGWPFPDKPDFAKLNAEADAARERLNALRRELRHDG